MSYKRTTEDLDRWFKAWSMRERGVTYREIGEALDVSSVRARAIVLRHQEGLVKDAEMQGYLYEAFLMRGLEG